MSEISKLTCIKCGIHFGLDGELTSIWDKFGKDIFFCPNGCALKYQSKQQRGDQPDLEKENKNLKDKITSLTSEIELLKNELEIWRPTEK